MAKNKRECPALRETITSARCGEQRGVKIQCPEECAFNPFGPQNSDQFLEIERRAMFKAIDRCRALRAGPATEALLRRIANVHETVAFSLLLKWFREDRDPDGRTFVERWEDEGCHGLSNDECRVFRANMTARIGVLEVRRQLDDTRLEVVDILDEAPVPFIILDPALVNEWVRFGTWISWIYEAPHFTRPTSTAIPFNEIGSLNLKESLAAIITHLGGPAHPSEARDWLPHNLERFLKSTETSRIAVQEATLKAMKMQVGRVRYDWAVDGAWQALDDRLRASPDFNEGELTPTEKDDGWVECWDRIAVGKPEAGGQEVDRGGAFLGRVLLGPCGAMLCGSSGAPHSDLREHFESVADGLAAFQLERIDDLPSQILQRHPRSFDASLVPSAFLEHVPMLKPMVTQVRSDAGSTAGRMADHLTHHLRTWLDEPVPALANHTPRAAVAEPSLRPKVVELMKQQVRSFDTRARESGFFVDLNGILEELGLHELILPPPEFPASSHGLGFGDGEEEGDNKEWLQALFEADRSGRFEAEDWDYDPSIIEMPVKSCELSMAEVVGRVSESIRSREHDSGGIMANMLIQWPELTHLVAKLGDRINPYEQSHLTAQLLLITAVMFPVRPGGLKIHPGRVWHYFEEESNRIHRSISKSNEIAPDAVLIADCPQEALLRMSVSMTLSEATDRSSAPEKAVKELRGFAILEIVAFMRAFIRELSHWPVK